MKKIKFYLYLIIAPQNDEYPNTYIYICVWGIHHIDECVRQIHRMLVKHNDIFHDHDHRQLALLFTIRLVYN